MSGRLYCLASTESKSCLSSATLAWLYQPASQRDLDVTQAGFRGAEGRRGPAGAVAPAACAGKSPPNDRLQVDLIDTRGRSMAWW